MIQIENSSIAVCFSLYKFIFSFTTILLINLDNVLPTLSCNGYRNSHEFKLELCKFGEEMDVLKIESLQIKLFVCSESSIYGNMVIYANLCYQTM